MKKIKLLLLSCALLGAGTAWAQTDVTSTYMVNPSFEKANATTGDIGSTGVITEDWNITSISYARCAIFNSSSTVSTYGGTTSASNGSYYLMIRSNLDQAKTQNIKQNSDMSLPKGKYTVSFDYKAARVKDVNRNLTISAINTNDNNNTLGKSTIAIPKVNANSSYIGSIDWSTSSFEFTLESETNSRINISCETQGTANSNSSKHTVVLLDNFIIKYSNINCEILANLLAQAKLINSKLGTLNDAVSAAQSVYDGINDTPAYQATIDGAISTLQDAIDTKTAEYSLNPSGDDVSVLYIWNNGFDFDINFAASSTTATTAATVYPTFGWTPTVPGNCTGATIGYGYSGSINGGNATAPTQNADGTTTGGALAICIGWSGQVTYKSLASTLPAGSYRITYRAYNGNTKETGAVEAIPLVGFVPTTGDAQINNTTETFANQTWSTHTYDFELADATEGQIQIGLMPTSHTYSYNAPELFIDEVKLEYFNPLILAQIQWQEVHDALAALDATALPNAAENAITTELAKSVPTTTPKDVNTAKEALQALIDSYDAIKAAYDKLNALITLATNEKTNSTGTKTDFENAITTATTNKETRTAADDLTSDYNTLETARQTYVTSGAQPTADHVFDFTFKIADAAVTGTGWSASGTAVGEQYTGAPDNRYFDCGWNSNLNKNQKVEALPAGYYTLKAATRAKATEITAANVYANQDRSELNRSTDNNKDGNTGGELGNGWSWTEVNFEMRAAGDVTVGFYAQTTGQGWAGADDFHLYYKGNAVDNETANALIAMVVEGKMNSTVSGNQITALNTFQSNKIIENYDALESAIKVANASVEDYATGKAAIDKADDILSKTNVYTADAYATFSEALDAARTNYNDETWADTDGAKYKNSVFGTGWHSNATIDDLLTSAWDVSARNWDNYHVNTWSTIDDSGNPNLVVPTLEYWVSESNKLADKVMIATVAVEPYETYSVSAFITMAKNSVDYATDAETAPVGVTVQTGEGTATTCTGTRVAETRFFEGTFEATGEADANGNLTFRIAVTETDASWIMFRDVKYTKQAAAEATEAEKNALLAVINTAKENTLGFEKNQFAPYNNIDALEKLAAAESAYANSTTKPAINGTKDALSNATWTPNTEDVDAIYNGTFAETGTGNNPKGWTRSNNGWGQQITGLSAEANGVNEGTTTAWYYNNNGAWQYGNDGCYTMPLAANQAYVLSFKYSKHGNDWQNWMKASVINDNNEGLEVVEFAPANNSTNYVTATAYFISGAAGNYILSIEQNGNAHLTDVSLVKAESATLALSENANYTPTDRVYYEEVELTRSIKGEDTWNTFVVPFDITNDELKTAFGNDVAVAEFSEDATSTADAVVIAFNTMGTPAITANKPVLLKGNASTEVPYTFSNKQLIKAGEAKAESTNADFVGTYAASTTIDPGDYFISGNKLWKSKEGSTTTIKGTRAYIKLKNPGSEVKMFIDDEDNATSITEFSENAEGTEAIYNVAGQRISKMQKGINIVNGKKILK